MHFLGYNMLTKYLIWIKQKSWISLERDAIWQKGKHHSSLLKAFQICLFFNTSIFHFIGILKVRWQYTMSTCHCWCYFISPWKVTSLMESIYCFEEGSCKSCVSSPDLQLFLTISLFSLNYWEREVVNTYDTLTRALTYLTFFLQFNVKKLKNKI